MRTRWLSTKTKLKYSFLLLLPTILVLILSTQQFNFAYDSQLYLQAMSGHKTEGLLLHHMYDGYRAYLFPYFFSLFPFDLSHSLGIPNSQLNYYSLTAVTILLAIEFTVLWMTLGTRFFKVIYPALFLNPLLLVYIPYPMQESFILLLFALFTPLLLLLSERRSCTRYAISLGLFMGLLYMTRSSLVLFMAPAIISLLLVLRSTDTLTKLWSVSLFVLAFGLLLVPQVVISYKFFGTLNPYPATNVLDSQLAWGSTFTKYGTNLSANENVEDALPYWNPLHCKSPYSENTMHLRRIICKSTLTEFSKEWSRENLFKLMIHSYNALNYDFLQPYTAEQKHPIFSFTQLLSALLTFLGFYTVIRKWYLGPYYRYDILIDGLIFVTLAITALIAVETRFGVIATLALSVRSAELIFSTRLANTEKLAIGFGSLAYMVLSALLSIYVLSYSGFLGV